MKKEEKILKCKNDDAPCTAFSRQLPRKVKTPSFYDVNLATRSFTVSVHTFTNPYSTSIPKGIENGPLKTNQKYKHNTNTIKRRQMRGEERGD